MIYNGSLGTKNCNCFVGMWLLLRNIIRYNHPQTWGVRPSSSMSWQWFRIHQSSDSVAKIIHETNNNIYTLHIIHTILCKSLLKHLYSMKHLWMAFLTFFAITVFTMLCVVFSTLRISILHLKTIKLLKQYVAHMHFTINQYLNA